MSTTETPPADTAEASEDEAKPKRRGPRMCENCGERRAAGGDAKIMGEMTKLCTPCSADMIREGRCPMCRKGINTQHHQETCLKQSEEAAA